MTLSRETAELVRRAAVTRWEAECKDELLVIVDDYTSRPFRIRETDGDMDGPPGYWVPALVFVSKEEVERDSLR